jgi:ankyrin repeat protein/beta-lactamase regulating signal transducer with metallopeptidase domain
MFVSPGIVVRVPVPASSPLVSSGRVASVARGTSGSGVTDGLRSAAPATAFPNQPMAAGWLQLARWSWLGGALVLFISLLLACWRVSRLRRHSLPRPDLRPLAQSLAGHAGTRSPVDILEHEDVAAPLTCGVRRPAVILPIDARGWADADLRRALVHELEHVRRRDWVTQLIARAVCACYWFHPLVWTAWRALCLEAERACDDAVVRSAERTDYADQLVLLARRMRAQSPAVLGMANRSDLATRVAALLDDRQRRGRAGLFAATTVSTAAALLVIGIAPLRAVAAPAATATLAASSDDQTFGRTRRPRSRALDNALYEAAGQGDIAEIDALLQSGADVNAALSGDGSPLIAAARNGRVEVVRHLLDRGADANMAVLGDASPLIEAARTGSTAIVALLLDRGADVNRGVPGDGNALIMAAREGEIAVVRLLVERGANIEEIVPEDENALISASAAGQLDVVKFLIARDANVNARAWAESARERPGGEWRTPLNMARRGGHTAVVAVLIAAGARE